ncbi:MAG: hypothetical protein QXY82_00145 [Desulfurococcaceae archaeon]
MVTLVYKYCLLAMLLLTFLLLVTPVSRAQEGFPDEIASVMRDLEYLHSRGLDLEPVIEALNKAIEAYYKNDVAEAREYLERAKHLVEELKPVAETVHLVNLLTRICTVIALASIPLVVYFALPRLYLYLWFTSRKKWIVIRR